MKKLVKFFQGDTEKKSMEEKIDRRKEKNKEWNKVIKRSEKEMK